MSASPDKDALRAEAGDDTADAEAASPATPGDMASLVARGDADGLIELARAYRSGTGETKRDLSKCLACYLEAAKLGSAEANYSVALFYLSGGVVAQDLKEGATRLRIAADGGYLPAKVYLANLYDLGVHFAADKEKADVWYRSAARAAGITSAADSVEYAKAMADLGCARHCLSLAEDQALPEAERERLLRKAKAYGYQLVLRRDSRTSLPAGESSPAVEAGPAPAQAPQPSAVKARAGPGVGAALVAFFYATLFVGAAVAAGYFLTKGAEELVGRGANLSLVGKYPRAIFPAILTVVGVLPSFLLYKGLTVVRAVGVGLLLGGAAYALWGAPQLTLLPDKEVQALVVGAGAFLAALLVFGLWGGVKPKRRPPPRILT